MIAETPDTIAERIASESANRIREADAAERRSEMAFRTGRMEDYWIERGKEAEARVEAEYERIEREANAAGPGDGESGGSGAGASVSSDGGNNPLEPATEKLPPTD
jgi:hypothetical protein